MDDPNYLCARETLETLRVNDHAEKLSISSAKLHRILSHWLECRANRLMPMWRDIQPAKIKAELPIVWQYRYNSEQDEFFGGLAGEEIQRLIGGPIKNARFRHLHRGDPHLFARAKRVLFEPAIYCGRGLLFKQRERQCFGERIVLPFAGIDGTPAGIFGATDYSYSFLYQEGAESHCEVEQWCLLNQWPSRNRPSGNLLQRLPPVFSRLRRS